MIKTLWVVIALTGTVEKIPNMKPEAIYHYSKDKCQASIRVIERGLADALRDMPVAFFCKKAKVTHDGNGDPISWEWVEGEDS